MTLCVNGYQFGRSNHTVYLVDAYRQVDPQLLSRDWYTTDTMRYHGAFAWLSETLLRAGLLEAGFLVGYLLLVVLLHLCWVRIARALGAGTMLYLLSVVLYEVSAGGTGLGMYRFLQDGCFLPSNIANVLMLWGIYFCIVRRFAWCGLLLGAAGLFHLNHALVGIGLFGAMTLWDVLDQTSRSTQNSPPFSRVPKERGRKNFPKLVNVTTALQTVVLNRSRLLGALMLLTLSLPNVLPAVRTALAQTDKLPLSEFVALYVRLRHPHHYDPSTWPVALWVMFLWPIGLALLVWSRSRQTHAIVADASKQATRLVLIFCALMSVSLVFAGIVYVSEPLIQMSLWRFSIYVKLLTCIGAAVFLARYARGIFMAVPCVLLCGWVGASLWGGVVGEFAWRETPTVLVFFLLACVTVFFVVVRPRGWVHAGVSVIVLGIVGAAWGRGLGFGVIPEDSADHLEMCDYVKQNTPTDALLLVPPDEQSMRLRGLRSVVINFKGVPQLSGEMSIWRDRLQAVLNMDDLTTLPSGFGPTLRAIGRRYDALDADDLTRTARMFGADYIVTRVPVEFSGADAPVFVWSTGREMLYHLPGKKEAGLEQ